ncbi:MAG TPA: hypothetical protein VM010_01970 [Chitinophagaceae bacterium]|nr:hypothetical protein [Chitinophagaceae bacterium]
MKKIPIRLLVAFLLPLLLIGFASFKSNRGGDIFIIYLNGKQVHRQFVHIDKSVKTLHLDATDDDVIDVSYSHCGAVGTNRVLTLRNGQNAVVKELRFPDVSGTDSKMRFSRKSLGKNSAATLKLYYAATELPDGKLLSIIQWREKEAVVKR